MDDRSKRTLSVMAVLSDLGLLLSWLHGMEAYSGSEAPPGFHDIGNNLIFVHRVDDINPFVKILILDYRGREP